MAQNNYSYYCTHTHTHIHTKSLFHLHNFFSVEIQNYVLDQIIRHNLSTYITNKIKFRHTTGLMACRKMHTITVTSLHFACPYNTNNSTQKLCKLKQRNINTLN